MECKQLHSFYALFTFSLKQKHFTPYSFTHSPSHLFKSVDMPTHFIVLFIVFALQNLADNPKKQHSFYIPKIIDAQRTKREIENINKQKKKSRNFFFPLEHFINLQQILVFAIRRIITDKLWTLLLALPFLSLKPTIFVIQKGNTNHYFYVSSIQILHFDETTNNIL